jgi:hypothetical protein
VVIEGGNECAKTDQARKPQQSENLRAAITVSLDYRFHGCEHYPHTAHLTCAEGHEGGGLTAHAIRRVLSEVATWAWPSVSHANQVPGRAFPEPFLGLSRTMTRVTTTIATINATTATIGSKTIDAGCTVGAMDTASV